VLGHARVVGRHASSRSLLVGGEDRSDVQHQPRDDRDNQGWGRAKSRVPGDIAVSEAETPEKGRERYSWWDWHEKESQEPASLRRERHISTQMAPRKYKWAVRKKNIEIVKLLTSAPASIEGGGKIDDS
jgi:hypothetical protein